MIKSISLAFKDFFTFRFLMFSLAPLICSSILFFGLLSYIIHWISEINIDDNTFNFFLGIYIAHAIQIAILLFTGIGGGFLALHLSVFFALFIVSFLTPFVVKEINLKHYNYIKLDEVSFVKLIFILFKYFLKFFILFFFALIFYTIPIINLFAPIIMFFVMFYFYYHFLIIDVASCVLNKDDFLLFNPYKYEYLISIFIFYVICNIPVLGFFLQVFFVIFLAHLMFNKEIFSKINN